MGITKDWSLEMGYGAGIPNGYLRISSISRDYQRQEWRIEVEIYPTKEARDMEKIADYFYKKYVVEGVGVGNAYPPRPSNISPEKWSKIEIMLNQQGQLRKLSNNGYMIREDLFNADANSLEDIYREAYYQLKTNSPVKGAVDSDVDLPIETLVANFLAK